MRAEGVLLIKDAAHLKEEFKRKSEVYKPIPPLIAPLREIQKVSRTKGGLAPQRT